MLRHKIISKDEPFSAGVFVVNQLESDDKQNELLDDRHRIAGKLMIILRHLCRAVDICVVPLRAIGACHEHVMSVKEQTARDMVNFT